MNLALQLTKCFAQSKHVYEIENQNLEALEFKLMLALGDP